MVERNGESRWTYNVNSDIKFKTTMLKSSLYDYSDAYILVKGTITVPSTSTKNTNANNVGKKVIFENCASNEPRFNGVYSRDKLPDKIKKGAYVINLDAFSGTVTPWILWYVSNNNVTYFESFGVQHIPKRILKKYQ